MTQQAVKQRERREDMQTRRSSTLAVRLVAMFAVVGALVLLGCPSDDDDDAVVIGTRAAALRAGNAGALGNQTFIFPGPDGVPAFDTRRTQIAFNADASEATISAGGDTTTAGAEYGSCIFTPGEDSTFPPGSPLGGTDPIRIELCNLIINGGVFTVGGLPGPCTIRLELGTALSVAINATCAVNLDGDIIVNGATFTGSVGVGG
jgi:hypothetical protein